MMRLVLAALVLRLALAAQGAETALVLTPAHNPAWEPVAKVLEAAAMEAGYTPGRIGYADLTDPAILDPDRAPLLILPDASTLPMEALPSIDKYLQLGGDLFACNTPMGETLLLEEGDSWLTLEEFGDTHASDLMEHPLYDFAGDAPLDSWRRNTNDPTIPVSYVVGDSTPGKALHVSMDRLTNWETFIAPAREVYFPDGDTLTVFWAKGGPNTTELAIEWSERDSSRWIATVPLTDQWRQYVLQPSDFLFWESVPSRMGTAFNPAEAAQVSFGLARSHVHVHGEEQDYWLGPIGTAPRTAVHEKLLTKPVIPRLETLCPAYKFYPVSDVARALVPEMHAYLEAVEIPLPQSFQCIHPRPSAAGFDKGRDWRWLSLLEAESESGDWRGAFATLFVNTGEAYKESLWASVAVIDPAWYAAETVAETLRKTLARMRDGLFLLDGGADHFTYFEEQERVCGVTLVNCGNQPRRVDVSLEVSAAEDRWKSLSGATVNPGEVVSVSERVIGGPTQGRATVSVMEGERLLDWTSHPVSTWHAEADPNYITIEDGDFMLDGQRWRPHGVNYMPSSGIGTEDQAYFEYWIGARAYDPVVIERDLRRVKAMGMNAISVFIYRESMEDQNLLDLLRICDELDLYVNLSLRPGTPLDFQWEEMRELIEYYHLSDQHRVFALDLAWEPMFPEHEHRMRWDAEWRDWVLDRYGSMDNAIEDWGFEPPRDANGELTNPLGHMTTTDGEWRVYVAAYRRFLDTLLYEYYRAAYDRVRALDPHHAISFRMTEGGNPTFNWEKHIPYDYPYIAAAVDIFEPEAYGRIGDWEKVKPGWFQYEHARWAAPELPFMWAEAGVHVWSRSAMTQTPELLDFQAQYYRDLYRMFIGSAADGIFFWWYPGGYRVNEHSDYGILNPDGTDRPVTKVIREQADALINGPDAPEITTWLTIDRDQHPAGINGIYEANNEAFWSAIENGDVPGLRTEATGTDSTNCPLVAVGNVPYNGENPPKYLDGYFDKVEVRVGGGEWVQIAEGNSIPVKANQPVSLRVTAVNLGEATWVASADDEQGSVCILVSNGIGPNTRTRIPHNLPRHRRAEIADIITPPIGPEPVEMRITFEAAHRATFGPKFTFRLVPE
jgi:hypothetical protein